MTSTRVSSRAIVFGFILLIALDVAARLTPHAPNCTPLAASALFASFFFESSFVAAGIPILAMAISDYFLGTYDWRIMIVVYLSLTFPVLFKRYLLANLAVTRVITSALASSVLFFLTTNFAVWSFTGLYPRDMKGLAQCYIAAIPFFRNTIAGDLFWSCGLFGGYALLSWLVQQRRVSELVRTNTRKTVTIKNSIRTPYFR